ncbi:LysR family transcriptional regulator [Paraburkholderia sp. SIMBA_050]
MDLNLLLVFDSLLRTRSTTLAADELNLTQSSISNALKRLRTSFGDPLFVKTKDGMLPTCFAEGISGHIRDGLSQFRVAVEQERSFDPRSSERSFTICMSDIGQMVIMPTLISYITSAAPNIRIVSVDATVKEAHQGMSTGAIDLSIGVRIKSDTGFYQQILFREHFVAIVRKGHPMVSSALSLKQFLAARQAVFKATPGSHAAAFEETIERVFEQNGETRLIATCLGHSLGLSKIIAGCDLLVCVPSLLADAFSDDGVKCFPLPFQAPTFDISQIWHLRCQGDAGHRWLRGTIASLFANKSKIASGA